MSDLKEAFESVAEGLKPEMPVYIPVELEKVDYALDGNTKAVRLWDYLIRLKAALRSETARIEQQLIEYFQENKLNCLEISDTAKLLFTYSKRNRFETEEIYKALDFSAEQVAVLPKNPAFRKTAILKNEKTSHCHYEEDINSVEAVKDGEKPKKKLVEFDSKFIK